MAAIQGLPQVYADFKAMMETMIPANSHLGPTLARFQTLFTKLSQAKYTIPNNIQVVIILSHLPHTILIIMQLLVQTKDSMSNVIAPTLSQITAATILNWKQCTHMGSATSKGKNSGESANKINAVKYKKNDPSFQKQQDPKAPFGQQQGDSAKDKEKGHGKCDSKKQREKRQKKHLNFVELKDSRFEGTFSYFVNTASISAVMDPHVATHQSAQLYQGASGSPMFTQM